MIPKPQTTKKNKIFNFSVILFAVLLLIFFFYPGQNIYQTVTLEKRPLVSAFNTAVPTVAPYPVNATKILPPDLTSQAILVVDIPSGVILFQKNPQVKLSPASTTKIMTALVAMDYFKMDDILTVKTVITEGRAMGLASGDKLTFENLLYGTLVHSGNDAAFAIAENYSGGVDNFVKKMNAKAKDIYLLDTSFANPVGFEDSHHFTTAKDLARLATYALNNSYIAKIVGTPDITVADVNFTKFYRLENVNELLGKIPGVLGVKTGWTENAGECLVTAVTRDSRKILLVVLDSKDRFGETETLINWVFANYNWNNFSPQS